jgi:methyltransferase
MPPEVSVPAAALASVAVMMLAEARRSRFNERALRREGAFEPPGDVYRAMAIVYPGMFLAMAAEGVLTGPASDVWLIAGFAIFAAAKVLKVWAIATLGPRWSYRVLVVPASPLVATGPYAHLRHPNYVAVFGEIAGFAMMVHAAVTGILSMVVFAILMRKRIAVEERALGL